MHSKSSQTAPLLALIFSAGLLWGCQIESHGKIWPVPTQGWGDLDKRVAPSLEQIFLDPPLTGTSASIEAVSADGLWLLTQWRDPALKRSERNSAGDLRLLSCSADTPSNGSPINEVLGLESEEQSASGPWTWSFEGATLAIARDRRVYLLEPARGKPWLFLEGPTEGPAPEALEGDEQVTESSDRESTQAAELPAFEIQSLAFAPDGQSLRAFINDDLYVFALQGPLQAAPLTLADGQCLSADFESKPSLDWSDDLRVVFGNDPYPMPATVKTVQADSEPEAADEAADSEQVQATKTQIWHVKEQRAVALEGMQEMRWLESSSLSADGRFVFGASYDRRAEPEQVHVPNYLTERVSTRRGRRLLAEDGPSYFDLFIWNTESGERSAVLPEEALRDWELMDPEAHAGKRQEGNWWLREIGWAPQKAEGAPARFAFERVSADYHQLELWVWSEGQCKLLWRDYDARWIGGPARYSSWSSDGSYLLVGSEWGLALDAQWNDGAPEPASPLSSTPGSCQLFRVHPESGQARQLTHFEGELTRFYSLPGGGVVVNGSRANAAQREIGVIEPEDLRSAAPSGPVFAELPPGWNEDVRSSSDGRRLIYSHGELMHPAELWFTDAEGSHAISAATPSTFFDIDWIKPERISVLAADGTSIWAHVYLPKGVTLENPGGARRAAIVFVHGAGYLQNVTDSMTRYEPNMLFHSRLAQMGYPVIDVDYRGSSGYGSRFRSDVQYHLGGLDLDDIHLVLGELVRRGLVDSRRVGLYGGSYGGFLTMMALFTAPERWAVGAALRSVTDWRTYHPTYTQPRLGRPSTHAEAYAKSSPINHYQKLEDPLLVLHGMMDDNVFAQDSIRLIEALIDQGSDFEAMLYPSQRHGFSDDEHWLDQYRRIERFLLRYLGPPLADQ